MAIAFGILHHFFADGLLLYELNVFYCKNCIYPYIHNIISFILNHGLNVQVIAFRLNYHH